MLRVHLQSFAHAIQLDRNDLFTEISHVGLNDPASQHLPIALLAGIAPSFSLLKHMAEFMYQTCCHCSHGEKSYLPLTARRSNQSILKETIPEYSLEGLILK